MNNQKLLLCLLYGYPVALWMILLVSSLILRKNRWTQTYVLERRESTWNVLYFLQAVLALLFVTSAALSIKPYIAGISEDRNSRIEEGYLIQYTTLSLYFLAGLLSDPEGPFWPSSAHCHAWMMGILMECMIMMASIDFGTTSSMIPVLTISAFRIAILILMCFTYFIQHSNSQHNTKDGPERESLLDGSCSAYGTTQNPSMKADVTQPKRRGWLDYFIGFRILFPYLWPSDSKKHQLILLVSLILLIGQRIINILVPYQLEKLVNALGTGTIPYPEIALYTIYRGLQGQQGVLGSLRAILWIPVSQSLFSRLTRAAFEHTLNLSLEFHLSKKIGEVLSAQNKGSALNTFLDSFAFQLFPMLLDLGIAAAYFLIRLDPFYSLVIIAVMWCYVYMTIYMAMWRATARRDMANKNREMDATKMDTIMSYEAVHHHGAVPTEMDRFTDHVHQFQDAEWRVLLSLNLLNITQNMVLTIGVLLVVLISALQISIQIQTVAIFVGILGYFTQLQAPLQFFGSFYSQVQNNLVDSERMLDLFKEKPTIVDSANATDLPYCEGRIAFTNVSFAYAGRKPALQNIAFNAEPGTSTAIVGESGSGKSTLLKLLFRFYDVTDGFISLDGRDVRDLKLLGLRSHFGIVPQDTILFNTSILYNLKYARPSASMEEVHAACRSANIHDRIISFPDGYETMVGERGLRLSGGEKQRIAIARAILKDPQVILLDEATASLDTETENQIQTALNRVVKGRTTITIAHRLSTITSSDQILVLHQGHIVERGTHQELLALGGRYLEMWNKQTKTDIYSLGDCGTE